MDPNDPNLNGEITATPTGSQPGTTTSDSITNVNPQGASNGLSPEEVAWNELRGGTQDRIKTLLRERDEERLRAERAETYAKAQASMSQPQPQTFNPNDPKVADAVRQLSDVGIATDEKVNQVVNQRMGNLIYNFELRDLEKKYDGSNGLPKFDKGEYEDFVDKNPQYRNYAPEDVYQMKMYPEEIMDARVKDYKGNNGQSTTSSLRPTATVVREDSLTPDFIERRLQQPDGRKWYSENRDRINSALASQPNTAE